MNIDKCVAPSRRSLHSLQNLAYGHFLRQRYLRGKRATPRQLVEKRREENVVFWNPLQTRIRKYYIILFGNFGTFGSDCALAEFDVGTLPAADSIMSSEESIPVIFAEGKRSFRTRELLPEPHPMSKIFGHTTCRQSIRAAKSREGCVRSRA